MKGLKLGRMVCAVMMAMVILLNGTMVVKAEGLPQYRITVNRATNHVDVYTHDEAGNYTIPVIEFTCSTGKDNKTPEATTEITQRIKFHEMKGKVYSQFAVRFNRGCMFHAVPCAERLKDTLKTSYYNQLGEQASSGCVRLTVADSEWIYNNCADGTVVEVIDDANDWGPFGKPMVPKIPDGHPYANWDPTDSDPNNPWISERPQVKLKANSEAATLSLPVGASYDALYNAIGLYTPSGEIYTDNYALDIYGVYDLNTAGTYTLYVRGHDLVTTLRGDMTMTLVIG